MALDDVTPDDDRSFDVAVADVLTLAAVTTGVERWALDRDTGGGQRVPIASYGPGGQAPRLVALSPRSPGGTAAVHVPVPDLAGRPLATLTGYTSGRPDRPLDPAGAVLAATANLVGVLLTRQLWWSLTAGRAASGIAPDQRDRVTGLGTQRWWEQMLNAEELRCARYASRSAVVLVDLLGSTAFNAEYGHDAGDTRLREAARVLSGQIRRFDGVARLGADEFGILLVETSAAEAEPVAARLEHALRSAGLPSVLSWAVRDPGVTMRQAWHTAHDRMRRNTARPAAQTGTPETGTDPACAPQAGADRAGAAEAGTRAMPGQVGRPAAGQVDRPVAATLLEAVAASAFDDDTDATMQRVLDLVRRRIGADMAFIAELTDEQHILRWVSSATAVSGLVAGHRTPAEETYCRHMLDGRLSNVVPDTARDPVTSGLDITRDRGIGSYLGIPLVLPGGRQGTLCCVSQRPDTTLNRRDADYLADAADLIIATLGPATTAQHRRHEILHRLDNLRRAGGPTIVVQPIVDLRTGRVAGVEALSRFPQDLGGTPLQWFTEAAEIGQTVTLELLALRKAVTDAAGLDGFLAVNLSPTAVMTPGVIDVLATLPLHRIVLELTEHEPTDDLTDVAVALAPLRERGLRIAIDDLGAGYAGLTRLTHLRPDIIKLDIALVRGVEHDTIRQSLAQAFIAFAAGCDAQVVAEGIERVDELTALRRLGAHLGQGWALCRPLPPGEVPDRITLPPEHPG